MSTFQRVREKKAWARSCGQARARPAPVSIPVTAPAPVCATSPATIAVNVVNPGAVNTRSFPSTASSDIGTIGLAGIGFPSPGAVATTTML
ncbi:hypothetical protein, partial [Streptomyces aureus]|uniref:hypothetical protein n=1 Tax=Streptomyces aureus TaxID=193461 RepID=UPI0031DB6AF2